MPHPIGTALFSFLRRGKFGGDGREAVGLVAVSDLMLIQIEAAGPEEIVKPPEGFDPPTCGLRNCRLHEHLQVLGEEPPGGFDPPTCSSFGAGVLACTYETAALPD
jgi:hypothetical protein